jgi:hypothetical protein
MMDIRATIAVAFADLLGVPVKVREDYHRPDWSVSLDITGEPCGASGIGIHGRPI